MAPVQYSCTVQYSSKSSAGLCTVRGAGLGALCLELLCADTVLVFSIAVCDRFSAVKMGIFQWNACFEF